MVTVKELKKVLAHCNDDMPIVLEVEKGVHVALSRMFMEDTDKEYRVVLRCDSKQYGDVEQKTQTI